MKAVTQSLETRKRMLSKVLPLLGLIALTLVFTLITGGRFLAGNNMQVLLNQAFNVLVAGIGATFVYAHGGMDLSIAGLAGACMCLLAFLLTRVHWVIALLATVVLGMFSGFATSGISIGLNIPAFIVSICVNNIWRGVVLTITAQEWLEAPAYFLAFDNWIVKITVLAVLIAVGYYMFDFTRIGKDMKAIGGNANVAELSGVRVTRQKTLAYVIMGIFTAFAAFFSLARVGVASSTSGNGLDMDVLIALLLGGLPLTGGAGSRMSCAVVGAFSLAVLGNGLLLCGVTPNAVDGVKGAVLIFTVFATMRKNRGQVVV